MKSLRISLIGILFACMLSVSLAQTLYVATNGENSDGLTWQTAYTTIQAAIDAAAENDIIVVGSSGTDHGTGLYVENIDITKPLTLESEGGFVATIVQAATTNDHAIYVISTNNVTIRGFSVYGATAANPVYAAGIYIRDSSYCTVENNRCGWKDNGIFYRNYKGIRVDVSDHCLITNNYVGYNLYSGIYMGQYASTPYNSRYNTISHNTCDQANSIIFVQSLSHNNNIIYNTCVNGSNIQMDNCHQNYVAFNSIVGANAPGIRSSMGNDNVIAHNTCRLSSEAGIKLSGDGAGYYNTVAYNTLTNNPRAMYIQLGTTSDMYTIVAGNYCSGNTSESVLMYYNRRNRFFLNTFNDAKVFSQYGTSNHFWSTATEMTYFTSSAHQNFMGNYYPGFAGTDTDGDGISDTTFTTSTMTDNYPLMNPPSQYNIQTWYLCDAQKMYMDFGKAPETTTIATNDSAVWCTKLAAPTNVDYPAASWIGQIRFRAAVTGTDILLEVGYTDSVGGNFVASGAQTTLSGSGTLFTYATTAQAFTVPTGKRLAFRVSNTSATVASPIVTGGAWCYLTAPAGSTFVWSDTIVGDIVAPEGVDLVDFSYLAERWGRTDCVTTGNCEGADLDKLGSVDIDDLKILAQNWLLGK